MLSVLYLYSESLTVSTQFITAHLLLDTCLSFSSYSLTHTLSLSLSLSLLSLNIAHFPCLFDQLWVLLFVQSWFYPLSYVWEWRWCNGKSKQYVIYTDFLEKAYSVALLRCIFFSSCGHINICPFASMCVILVWAFYAKLDIPREI